MAFRSRPRRTLRPGLLIGAVAIATIVAVTACTQASDATGAAGTARVFDSTLSLPSTFRFPEANAAPVSSPLIGHWRSASADLILVPRPGRAAGSGPGLFGAIPRGHDEGVLWLPSPAGDIWHGEHIDARGLRRTRTTIRHDPGSDVLVWERGVTTVRFVRAGDIRTAALQRVSIIGHRGLSLERGELMNTTRAIEHCWSFGCSGVELDITVPRDGNGQPQPTALRIYHAPDWRSEITGDDSMRFDEVAAAPALDGALAAAAAAGMPLVYLDPKLRWLLPDRADAARAALERIVAAASSHAITTGHSVVIGSETSNPGEAADIVEGLRRSTGWHARVFWALEFTRGTNLERALTRVRAKEGAVRPDVLSINLLRVNGGGGGMLRLFVSDIPPRIENALAQMMPPVVYWTAADDRQFAAAVAAIDRMQQGQPRGSAIITPVPHRLAFFLATHPGR